MERYTIEAFNMENIKWINSMNNEVSFTLVGEKRDKNTMSRRKGDWTYET